MPPPRNTLPPVPPPPRNALPPVPPLRNPLPPLAPWLIPPPPRKPPLMDPPPPRRCATPTPAARVQHKTIRNMSLIWRVPLLWSLPPHGRRRKRGICIGGACFSLPTPACGRI